MSFAHIIGPTGSLKSSNSSDSLGPPTSLAKTASVGGDDNEIVNLLLEVNI